MVYKIAHKNWNYFFMLHPGVNKNIYHFIWHEKLSEMPMICKLLFYWLKSRFSASATLIKKVWLPLSKSTMTVKSFWFTLYIATSTVASRTPYWEKLQVEKVTFLNHFEQFKSSN